MSRKRKRKKRIGKFLQKVGQSAGKTVKKVGKNLLPPPLYPFIPLMKARIRKKGIETKGLSAQEVVKYFYLLYVKKQNVSNYETDMHGAVPPQLVSAAAQITIKDIIPAIIRFFKNMKEKHKKGGADLSPEDKELAKEISDTDDDPKSKEIAEKAKKEQEAMKDAKKEASKEKRKLNFIQRILKALGLYREGYANRVIYSYYALKERTIRKDLEDNPENPLVLERKRIVTKKGKVVYVWFSPLLMFLKDRNKIKEYKAIAKHILLTTDIKMLVHCIKKDNTEKVYAIIDKLFKDADNIFVVAFMSKYLANSPYKMNLFKVLRMLPSDYYINLYNTLYNLKKD